MGSQVMTPSDALLAGVAAVHEDQAEVYEALAKGTLTPRGPRWGLDIELASFGAGTMAAQARIHRERYHG